MTDFLSESVYLETDRPKDKIPTVIDWARYKKFVVKYGVVLLNMPDSVKSDDGNLLNPNNYRHQADFEAVLDGLESNIIHWKALPKDEWDEWKKAHGGIAAVKAKGSGKGKRGPNSADIVCDDDEDVEMGDHGGSAEGSEEGEAGDQNDADNED